MLLALRSLWEEQQAQQPELIADLNVTLAGATLASTGTSGERLPGGVSTRGIKRPRVIRLDKEFAANFVVVPPPDAIAELRQTLAGAALVASATFGAEEAIGSVHAFLAGARLSSEAALGIVHLLDEEIVALLMAA